MNEHIPDIETYIKRLNWYLQEHYPANKKITAEEWNALFLALINQGNAQEDTLAKICNEYLPLQIEKINTLVDTTNEHEASIAQLRTDTNKALKDSNYAVITADTALNQVVEKMGTVAYINNVLAPSLHYTRDPQAQLDDTAQGIINLQSQIDLMEQNTNVADVVGTFVDLVNYDKSKLTANDIVEVLQDETRANADTYYRLVENAWVYIGKLGSYYTRGESDALLAEKVNYADYKDTLSFAENERQKSKNLFNINNTVLDYSLNLGETGQQLNMASTKAESYGRCCTNINNLIKVKPNTQYVITNNSTFKCSVGQINASRLVVTETGWKTDSTLTITTTSTTEYVAFNFGKTDDSKITNSEFSNFLLSHIQLEEGSVATDYQPYYGQITHNEDPAVKFAENERQKSKNLFKVNRDASAYYGGLTWTTNSATNSITFNGSTTDINETRLEKCIEPILMKANTPYTISISYISGYADIGGNFGVYSSLIGPFETKLMCFLGQNNSATLTPTEDIVMDSLRIWLSPDDIGKTFNNYTVQYQIEEGSVATDYQAYNGQISHIGDKEIEFARNEYEKSKNLIPYPYHDGNSIVSNGITFTVNNDQSISVSGTIIDHTSNGVMWLAWDMPLKAGTYRISDSNSSNDLSVVAWIGNAYYQKDFNNGMFTLSSDTTARIYLQVAKGSTKTYNDTIRFMLCKGTDTDWQPYNGAIVHEKEFHETLQNTPAITFAESERQKSKNLLNKELLKKGCYIYVTGEYENATNYMTFEPISVTPNSTITVSCNGFEFNSDCGFVFFNNGVYVGYLSNGATVATVPANANQVIYDFCKGNITKDDVQYAQLEYGSTATDYQPYYGQISHTGNKEIEFARNEYEKSKNLLNATTSETTFGNMTFSADTSNIYFNGSYTDADRCMFNSWALKKGTYTLNIEYISGSITRFENILFYLYKGGSWTQYSEAINLSSSNKAGSVSFTLDEDVNDARLTLYQNLTNTMTNCVFKYQIVEGTNSDFDFQPYNGAIVHKSEVEPVLIYDKDTKNTIGGKPYTAGIKSGTIIDHDFSQYKKLILTVYRDNVGSFDYEINLEYLDYSGMYGGSGIAYSFQAQDNYFVFSSVRISADKQQMVYIKSGYTETFFETMVSTNDVPILRIKGVK